MNSFTDLAIREIYDSHALIQTWFCGSNDATPELLERLFAKFSHDFTLINTKGEEINLDKLYEMFTTMRGKRPNLKIEITPPKIIFVNSNTCILQYKELHHMAQDILRRISTAVFIKDDSNRVLQKYLHETWIGYTPSN